MSRESKIFNPRIYVLQDTITHYEAFGWELLSINGNQITMSRETQNPVYSDLVKYQAKYEEKVELYCRLLPPQKPAAPAPITFRNCFWSFVCLVFPLAIYLTYKIKQKNKFKAAMEEYNNQYKEYEQKRATLRQEMDQIILDSRTAFFAKQ